MLAFISIENSNLLSLYPLEAKYVAGKSSTSPLVAPFVMIRFSFNNHPQVFI